MDANLGKLDDVTRWEAGGGGADEQPNLVGWDPVLYGHGVLSGGSGFADGTKAIVTIRTVVRWRGCAVDNGEDGCPHILTAAPRLQLPVSWVVTARRRNKLDVGWDVVTRKLEDDAQGIGADLVLRLVGC